MVDWWALDRRGEVWLWRVVERVRGVSLRMVFFVVGYMSCFGLLALSFVSPLLLGRGVGGWVFFPVLGGLFLIYLANNNEVWLDVQEAT